MLSPTPPCLGSKPQTPSKERKRVVAWRHDTFRSYFGGEKSKALVSLKGKGANPQKIVSVS